MAKTFLTSIDLSGNQLLKAILQYYLKVGLHLILLVIYQ